MANIEELGGWLLVHQSEKGSREYEEKANEYALLRYQEKYREASQLPDGNEKNRLLDRYRTEIDKLGGKPELSSGPMVTQESPKAEAQNDFTEVPTAPKVLLPQERDTSGADPSSRMLLGGIGAGAGAAVTGSGALMGALDQRAGRVAGIEERARVLARIQAMREARDAAARGRPVTPPAGGNLIIDPRAPVPPTMTQTGTAIQGNIKHPGTDAAQTGRASMTSFNQNTKDVAAGAREQQAIINALNNNPKTPPMGPIPSGFTGSSATGVALRPEIPGPVIAPEPALGNLQQLPPQNINPQGMRSVAALPAMAQPTTRSALDAVIDLYRTIASSPITEAAGRVARRVAPPMALAGAGVDAAELEHELKKDDEDRDYTKMALKGAGILGGGLSLIPHPATIALGTGLGLGASGLEYLYNQNRPVRPPKYGYGQSDQSGYSWQDLGVK